jgi:hypothetical protein
MLKVVPIASGDRLVRVAELWHPKGWTRLCQGASAVAEPSAAKAMADRMADGSAYAKASAFAKALRRDKTARRVGGAGQAVPSPGLSDQIRPNPAKSGHRKNILCT